MGHLDVCEGFYGFVSDVSSETTDPTERKRKRFERKRGLEKWGGWVINRRVQEKLEPGSEYERGVRGQVLLRPQASESNDRDLSRTLWTAWSSWFLTPRRDTPRSSQRRLKIPS